MSRAFIAGLGSGHPSLGFRITAPPGAAALRSLTVALPRGLSFVRHRAGKRLVLAGIHVSGGRGVSLSLSHGRLVITLHGAARSVAVQISHRALTETSAFRRQAAAHTLRRLVLSLSTLSTRGRRDILRVQLVNPGH